MLISAWLTAVRNRLNQTRMPIKRRAPVRRQARLEDSLESRTLLAAPTLVAVRPNIGDFLEPNETLTVAPKELTLQFNPGQQIDSSNNRLFNNSPIVVTRSGRDGTFSDGNEVPVTLGYVGLGATSEDVVLRFAQNLADDFYRITIKGSGSNPLQNTNREVFSSGTSDPDGYFYFRLNLGAQVRAVVPQPIIRNSNGSLTQQRDQIVVYFNQDTLDAATAQNRNFYQLHATRNTVENTDDVVHLPTSVSYSATTNTAVLTFANPIDQLSGNGQYRLRIGTDEAIPLPPTTSSYSEQFSSTFGTTGAAAATVTIDPIVSIDGNPITLAFSTSALDTNGMPSITVNNRAITVVLDSVGGTTPSQLAWAMNLNTQVNRLVRTTIAGNQYTNLTLTSSNINFAFLDPGSSFGNSVSLGTLSSQSQIISGQILSRAYPFDFPGNGDEPGHRDINVPDETHLEFPLDQDPQISTYFYNFQRNYGFTPQGAPLSNLITENQKQRTREIFDLFSKRMGVQFVETANQGFTVVTGDLRAINPAIITGAGGVIGFSSRPLNLAIMDNAETWDDSYAGSWFTTAMHEIGHLLGLGHAYDLPELTVMGGFEGPTVQTTTAEPDFPGDADVIHGQALYRPESRDIDLYRFVLPKTGQFTVETIAERMGNASLLNTVIRLYREESGGVRTLIGQNDDYFSKDSQLSMELSAGTYYIGVSASGNDAYDPTIQDNGMYGTTQGKYDLRLNFRPNTDSTIRDSAINQPSLRLDGDHDGVEGGVYNFWFRAVDINRLRVVDKSMTAGGNIVNLYNRINAALAAAQPGDIVRIVGNGGTDADVATKGDNVPFQIGLNDSGFELIDGGNMDIPKDVVVMIDAGAVFKMQGSLIGAGSSSLTVDRGGATLQVLGTPFQDVTMTSWRDETIGGDTTPIPTTPKAGNWGGLVFRRDVDNAEGRINYERQGIFMDYVAFASIQYGGGKLDVDSVNQIVNPITMVQARPGIYHNTITRSEDSAMSADPDSFEETTFTAPAFQSVPFTPDYSRVGPDIYGNTLQNNSTNGLFIRIQTAPGAPTRQLTVAGRFDDRDIVHVIAENLSIKGSPGGPFLEVNAPPVVLVSLSASSGGTLAAGTYNYRLVYVDAAGNQSPSSVPTRNVTVATAGGSVSLSNLPPAIAPYTSRRLYRSDDTGGGNYTLIANLNASSTTFTDNGTTLTGILDLSLTGRNRARLDASLVIDPDMILKLEGARIEVGMGAQLIAEAVAGREIIVTSRLDDRYGAGGTFDTNNDDSLGANEISPSRTAGVGLWGGIYLAPNSSASIDRALVTFGGNVIPTDGNFAGFNVIEAHQAQLRVANSIFEQNRDGVGGTAPAGRYGRTANASGTIFARGAQPVIINNIFRDNSGPVLSINANAMTTELQGDYGRSTGFNNAYGGYGYNQGPLVVRNLLGRNAVNGIVVRGETLTTQSVWDDTDIVHVLQSEITVPNFHTFGGLRLQSDPDASLVVKLSGANAGFTAAGKPLDIDDRIGGVLQIVGQPYFPVILTSLADDTVGAGFGLDGLPLKDTNNNGASTGTAGAWRSVLISQYAHDRNVAVYGERESLTATAPGSNATAFLAEFIGELGRQNFIVQNSDGTTTTQNSSDDNLRMGFEVHGAISAPNDVDVYSFSGTAGSEVWIDIDRTTHSLDTVVELISSTGTIIALSDNSLDEESNTSLLYRQSSLVKANPLSKSQYLSDDLYGTNQKDAGFRVVLPGVTGTTGTYQVRVRASNIDSLNTSANRADLIDSSKVFNGLTSGGYQLQIRLQETDEVPGTVVRYSDIRFATNGIEVYGQPVHSPLAGEYAESTFPNDTALASGNQDVGNILNTDKAAVSISGRISAPSDVDFYRFSITYDDIQQIPNHTNPLRFASVTFDVDYADGMSRANLDSYIFNARTNTLILTGSDSNIAEDRGGALEGADMDDLSRGSVGQYDPYIGPFELPEGDYYLVVAPHGQIPAVLAQTMIANPVSTATRIEPLPVVQRIFDAHFGGQGTLSTPLYQFGDGEQGQNVVRHHLGDVPMFVSDGQFVYIVNSFTGAFVNTVGNTGVPHSEIMMRPDGELYGWYATSGTDAGDSTYFQINTGTAARTDIGGDNILTYHDSDTSGNITETASNAGMIVTAFTYAAPVADGGILVASRGDGRYRRNLIYQFNARTGAAISQGAPRPANGRVTNNNVPSIFNPSGTDIVEIAAFPTTVTGVVQGIAVAGTSLYAVTSTGLLVELSAATLTITNQKTIRDANGLPVNLTGLTLGPNTVENGAYADTLFASDSFGNIYAIATGPNVIDPNAVWGDPVPFFVDGQSVLATGLPAAGITFGTLQYNLWQLTGNRGTDAGHGLTTSIDGTRTSSPGGASLYFGNTAAGPTAGNKNDLGAQSSIPEIFNYDFPGGAHGTYLSNPFSLEGYNASDKPVLYFNYFLATDSNDYIPGSRSQSDSIRAYVGDGTNWVLVATNDSYRGPLTGDDEQDYGPAGATTFPDAQLHRDVVELYDETAAPVWRQARVDLSNFAGRGNLRMRFEFATSGAVNVGDISTVGEEMFALDGSQLRDGQSWILEGCNQFELDMGYTLVAPSFNGLVEGETFTLNVDTEILTFEIDLQQANGSYDGVTAGNTQIRIGSGMNANEIARAISDAMRAAIAATPPGSPLKEITPYLNNNRINLARKPFNAPLTTIGTTLTQSSGAGLYVDGAPGVTPGTTPVFIHSGYSRNEVATAMKLAMAGHLQPAATYPEAELNNVADPLIAMDLEALSWTDVANNTIQENTVNPLPHITILGSSTVATGTDFYRFVVPAGALTRRVIVDLDGTNPTFNSLIRIVDANGATVTENLLGSFLDIGSNQISSWIDTDLAPGEYYLQIGTPPFAGGAAPGQIYTLHLSVEGHAINANGAADPLVVNPFLMKGSGDLVRIIGHYVTNQGPMGHTTFLPGDDFGGYYDTLNTAQRGQNNFFEGFYIDDIIIGFAERGEMVTNAPAGSNFIDNPEISQRNNLNPYQDIQEGAYDVEIRRSTDYASLPGSLPNPQILSRDTNDRFTNAVSIRVPNASALKDGQIFTISDGVNSVTFEYEDELLSNGVTQGRFAIPFNPAKSAQLDGRYEMLGYRTGESATVIAARIRDAINSTEVQGILKVRAELSDGADDSSVFSTSALINLTGTALVTVGDGLQKPSSDAMPDGLFGTMAALGNTNGSNSLFTFRNTTPYIDPNTGYPEQIHQIRIQLPAGQKFDPISILGGAGNGPTISPVSDFTTPTFTTLDLGNPRVPTFSFSSAFDIITIDFSQIVDASQQGPGFEKNDLLQFGLDVDFFAEPIWNLGATVDVGYSSGRTVTAQFVRSDVTSTIGELRPIQDPTAVVFHSGYGDQNLRRDQGQLVIASNFVSDSLNWGIRSDAGFRTGSPNPTGAGALTHNGPPRSLREPNINNWLPGIVIANNVIVQSGTGGILFSGDVPPGGTATVGPVPVGRILNNTIVGNPNNRVGVGIQVEQNSSPTLLNNIVADLATGISVDASSIALGTVIGGTLYRNNGTDAATGTIGLGTFPISLSATDPLFVDQTRRNYYPAPLSQAIDSSIDTLTDRTGFITVRDPLGLGVSPIKTPFVDAYGQTRGDDPAVTTPAAQGANVFKDRGAIDRVDFFRPTAYFSTPLDQSESDLNSALDAVWLNSPGIVRELIITLADIGIGIDDGRVLLNGSQFKLYMDDGIKQTTDLPDLPNGTIVTEGLMTQGVDYIFVYNSVTNEVIFRSTTAFPFERKYRVTVDNDNALTDNVDGVRDLAGNYLAPNRTDGTTQFTLLLTDGVNDPPVNSIPNNQSTPEDTPLTFSVSGGNPVSVSDADVWLGTNILRVKLEGANGVVSLSQTTGLTFTTGDGLNDATMEFTGLVDAINRALDGLVFSPAKDFFGTASITITTNDLGGFTGPPTPPPAAQQDVDVLLINVTPVNDAPIFNPLINPPTVNEDAGPQTVNAFMTGQAAGPANETPPQTITAIVTVTSVTGSWTTGTFFRTAPAINVVTGNLTYETATDVNGTATITVILRDSLGLNSTAQSFTITVNAVNDAPVFTVNPVTPIVVAEDAGNRTVDLINTFAAGPATALDEVAQTLTFRLSTPVQTTPNLALSLLTVDAAGNITFRSAADTAGVVSVSLTLEDSGPATPPDVNTSSAFPFTITVTQVNDAPVAVTGPYIIDDGYSLALDAIGSYDVDAFFGDTLSYRWDLNNDGVFETNAGASPTLTVDWNTLKALGITSPSVRTIQLQVQDSSGAANNTTVATTSLQTLIVDYGDAPASFGTLKVDGGAAHTISNSLRLGLLVDDERSGLPGTTASGDDSDGQADEDGVAFPIRLESSNIPLPAYVDITSSGAGLVDAWLDLDGNGQFSTNERLTSETGLAVSAGVKRFTFEMPADTPVGDKIMRFRLSTAGGLNPTGRAADGEVEDYIVPVLTLAQPVTPVITRPIDITPANGVIPQTSDSTPQVDWTVHPENFYYQLVVRNTTSGQVVFTGAQTTFGFQEVTPSLPAGGYTAEVTPYNKANTAGAAATYQFEVVTVSVLAPTGDLAENRPTIQWSPVLETASWIITVRSLSLGNIVQRSEVADSSLSAPQTWQVPAVLDIGRYSVSVQARDQAGRTGDESAPLSFQVRTAPVVNAPGNVTVPRPTLTWQAVPGAFRYQVELLNLTDNVVVSSVSGLQGTSWTVPTDLTLGRYQFRVRAVNASADVSFWSDPAVFGYTTPITAISPLNGIRLPDSTPTFVWNAVASADFYDLIVYQNFGSNAEVFRAENLPGTSFTRSTEMPLGRYRYQLRAVNRAGTGATDGDFATTSPFYTFVVTERPTIINPPATTFLARPTVSWTLPTGSGAAPLSDIWINKIEGSVSRVAVKAERVPGDNWTLNTDLVLGTYQVYVRTYSEVDAATVSDWSLPKTFRVTTPPTLIGPTGRIDDQTPTLSWQGVAGGQTYRVYVASLSLPGGPVVLDVSGINALNYTIPNDLPIGRYRFWAQARSAFGDISGWSSPALDFQIVTAPTLSGPSSSTFSTTPSFTWTNMATTLIGRPAGATSYDFRIDQVLTTSVIPNYIFQNTTATAFTVPASKALPNGTYRAYVRARSADTQGDYTKMLEFFVGGRPNVNAIPASSNQRPLFSWGTVDGASSYEVFLVNLADPSKILLRQAGIATTSYQPSFNLGTGDFRLWVRAFRSSDGTPGLWSNPVDFRVLAEVRSPQNPDQWMLTAVAAVFAQPVADYSVSMLRSTVSGTRAEAVEMPVVNEQPVSAPQQQAVTQPDPAVAPVESDEVLSGWGQETWWDAPEGQPPVTVDLQPTVPAKLQTREESRGATAGLLGALFGLVSLRRRRREEDGSV